MVNDNTNITFPDTKSTRAFVVIFAGGTGVRMNTRALPKQFLVIHGKPVLIHTLEVFEGCTEIDGIIVVVSPDQIEYANDVIAKYNISKIKAITAGGQSGQDSIYNGLLKAQKFYKDCDIVLIHDGVRPFIDSELIKKNIECVKKYRCAVSAVKESESVVVAEDGKITALTDKSRLWIARAPQSFLLGDIVMAHKKAIEEERKDFADSCALISNYSDFAIHIVECRSDNIKLTTPEDFFVFRAFFDKRDSSQLL
ncbi:MAG: 2-C-methyl-D-erythritol 4-phosphate cytidylyltransferase [Christensenellaceae bacterium]|jgi:2-C-methyl-D-erythritol 4-phosphate cytidylyltransferase|nr:2-C-methyl-D-erythritol 4-phosphate cytidylyltransferase [Christensenellaceae bacterium]